MLLPFRAAGRLWRSRTDYGRALGVHAESPRGTLLIQAIAGAAWPETATVSVDWVDDFVGSEPRERRQLRDPASWNAKLKPELAAAAETVRARGFTDVRIDGAFRLSTGFAAGAALPRAAGLTVTFRDWSSSSPPEEVPIVVIEHDVGQGDELAIGINVTDDLTKDSLHYLRNANLPVETLLTIVPASGPSQHAIGSPGAAVGFSEAAFTEIRQAARGKGKLHIFACCPNGIAILLGHRWNRVPDTQLYDDANGPDGYFPTFKPLERDPAGRVSGSD